MLSPNNETDRQRFQDNLVAAKVRDILRADAKRAPTDCSFSNAQISSLVDGLAVAPRPQEIHQERSSRYLRGTAAGMILWDGLLAQNSGQDSGLTKIKVDISNLLQRTGKKRGSSLSFLDNVLWKDFRPVAHLWLAYLLRQLAELSSVSTDKLCTSGDLLRFLAVAEQLRRDGELARFWKSNQPILHPAHTWKVPSSIRLPELTIRYSADGMQGQVTWQRPGSIAGAYWSSLPNVSRTAFEEALAKKVALAAAEVYPVSVKVVAA